MVNFNHLSFFILCLQNLLDRLELRPLLIEGKQDSSNGEHRSFIEGFEFESSLSHDFTLSHHPGLHNKVLALLTRRRQGTCCDVLQNFNDGLSGKGSTVFPEPFLPQMRVSGFWNSIFCRF